MAPPFGLQSMVRIRLARSLWRLLFGPMAGIGAGTAAVVFGVMYGGPLGIALVIAGAIRALTGLNLALMVLTVRVEVLTGALKVRWFRGEVDYQLTEGPITRVRVQGRDAARLRPQFGVLGWALGTATLRADETIEVVRLAPTPSMILLPTDRGRLAIAPRDDDELVDVVTEAVRRRRLAIGPPPPVEPPPAAPEEPALTGIERARLEEQLAAERAAVGTMPGEPPGPVATAIPGPTPAPGRMLTGIERVWLEEQQAAARAAGAAAPVALPELVVPEPVEPELVVPEPVEPEPEAPEPEWPELGPADLAPAVPLTLAIPAPLALPESWPRRWLSRLRLTSVAIPRPHVPAMQMRQPYATVPAGEALGVEPGAARRPALRIPTLRFPTLRFPTLRFPTLRFPAVRLPSVQIRQAYPAAPPAPLPGRLAPSARRRVGRPLSSAVPSARVQAAGVSLLPTLGASALWVLAGANPAARQLLLAVVLAGPLASAAAMLARAASPRLAGLVVAAALMALVLVGRAAIG